MTNKPILFIEIKFIYFYCSTLFVMEGAQNVALKGPK